MWFKISSTILVKINHFNNHGNYYVNPLDYHLIRTKKPLIICLRNRVNDFVLGDIFLRMELFKNNDDEETGMGKKILELIICMMLMGTFLIITLDTVSADQEGDYLYTVSGNAATITGYIGSGGAVTIPSTLGGYTTMYVGSNAFNSAQGHLITSVILPNSISTIGDNAFRDSGSLSSVTFGSGVTTIGDNTFRSCSSLISITFRGLVAPVDVGNTWILHTNASSLRGHAYIDSDFPPPGEDFFGLMMGAYISDNDPPVFGTPSPVNGSISQLVSFSWSIPITDTEGDSFSWSIQCSNGQSNGGSGAMNGTKSLVLSGLAYSTMYTIWVNATDTDGSGIYTRLWYIFTTKSSDGGGGWVPPENRKPIANTSAGEPYEGFVNKTILFDGSLSYDPDGFIIAWFWEFGDNTNGTGEVAEHIYSHQGLYNVTLMVTDDKGAVNITMTTCVITYRVNHPPTKPTIIGPTNGTTNTTYNFTVISTDLDNDSIRYIVTWGDDTSVPNSSMFLPSGTPFTYRHRWTTPGQYKINVSVTDTQAGSLSHITINITTEEQDLSSSNSFDIVVALGVVVVVAVICGVFAIFMLWKKGYI